MSAITAPAYIDNDGLFYVVINLVDTVPPAPEVPYVLRNSLVGHLTTIDLEFSGTAFAEPGLMGI